MSDTEEYTPPTEEVREDWVSTVITPGDYYDPISEQEARAKANAHINHIDPKTWRRLMRRTVSDWEEVN